ncbi:Peroxidase 16 [Capsicum annuum]|uniref:peroxidase n=1 Tax=Capsicum annuum TaxID=4072 RepID=A0A2G2Z1M8_CAPAN|nr:Peroxidase 16 [Capsicum annuum]KAF3679901.1 Peroxidase 16 [Capsicum annuum]PHT75883.1 Peroxidase 16 [Capsicum annuum]
MLLSSPNGKAAKDYPDNLSLAGDGFDTVVKAKAVVDKNFKCRNKVSCADILASATREVVAMHQLPDEGFNLDQLNAMFARRGLSQTNMIALSGAHTLGFFHCNHVSKRLYNFSLKSKIDPTLNRQYVLQLKKMCPLWVDPRIAINMGPTTPNTFDNAYFKNLQQGKGLFSLIKFSSPIQDQEILSTSLLPIMVPSDLQDP